MMPLIAHHWWEKSRNMAMVMGIITIPTAIYLATLDWHMLIHAGSEYVSFIALLGSLFIISGGLLIDTKMKGSPLTNATLLALGAVLASMIGTTGAAMVLIRPYLKMNGYRTSSHRRHIPIFFIFIVANAGGLLTPLGDPPLFLGFLRGVPFEWTFQLLPEWMFVNGVLIALHFLIDLKMFNTDMECRDVNWHIDASELQFGIHGHINFLFLLGVVMSAAWLSFGAREVAMVALAGFSWIFTKRETREANGYSHGPILEVMILFAGIFVTMQPALATLKAHAPEMGLSTPTQFFWITGVLSSFLDNAPTYVTFFTVAQEVNVPGIPLVAGVPETLLVAISLGAVFMGANTYIGNGPNFMVRSISAESRYEMPSFFGYMKWSLSILGPLWAMVWWLFL